MKKSILTLTVAGIITLALVTGCNSPSEKVQNAKDDVTEAKQELLEANEYLDDMKVYRKESAEQFEANIKSLVAFRITAESAKNDIKTEYLKRIEAFEKRNNDVKKKLDDYEAEGKEHWENFKTEFNHDMDELGKALKDITVINT